MLISKQYIITNNKSERFQDLQNELHTFKEVVSDIDFVYKFDRDSINKKIRDEYTAPRSLHKLALARQYTYSQEIIGSSCLSLCLNHIECLRLIQDDDGWSFICEDDIFIPDKDRFVDNFTYIFNNKPSDADILWVSSGKQQPNASFMAVTGRFPDKPIEIVNDYFWKINLSRFTDCILIKNSIAKELVYRFLKYKISMPIDWEYNYILNIDEKIKSYWLFPALVMQNPKFFGNTSLI